MIRDGRSSDFAAVAPLLVNPGQFRDRHVLRAYWEWQIERNPAAAAGLTCRWLALAADGTTDGFLAATPVPLMVHGAPATLICPMHLVARPGQGARLMRLLIEVTRRHEHVLFSTTGQPAVRRLFERHAVPTAIVGDYRCATQPVDRSGGWRNWLARWRPQPLPAGLRQVAEFPVSEENALSGLWRDAAVAVRKDRAWLNWRYVECPEPVHRIWLDTARGGFGYLVIRHRRGSACAWLLDLAGSSEEIERRLYAFAAGWAGRQAVPLLAVPRPRPACDLPLTAGGGELRVYIGGTGTGLAEYCTARAPWNFSFGDCEGSHYAW